MRFRGNCQRYVFNAFRTELANDKNKRQKAGEMAERENKRLRQHYENFDFHSRLNTEHTEFSPCNVATRASVLVASPETQVRKFSAVWLNGFLHAASDGDARAVNARFPTPNDFGSGARHVYAPGETTERKIIFFYSVRTGRAIRCRQRQKCLV